MEFDYTISTSKSFDVTVQGVEAEIAKVGMRVLYVHDVQKDLAEKGFHREPVKIIEFWKADIKISLCMPCKINVYTKDGQTFISGMRPIVLPQFFPQANLGEQALEIDRIIQSIINNVK